LSPSGQEITRFGQQYTGTNDSSVPFDTPSGVAFLGTRLIIANQSYFAGDKSNQALLALEIGEAGAPVYVPPNAGLAPAATSAKHKPARKHRKRRHHKRHRQR
jgi:hypothetical protein